MGWPMGARNVRRRSGSFGVAADGVITARLGGAQYAHWAFTALKALWQSRA